MSKKQGKAQRNKKNKKKTKIAGANSDDRSTTGRNRDGNALNSSTKNVIFLVICVVIIAILLTIMAWSMYDVDQLKHLITGTNTAVNFNPFATCGVLLVAVMAIMACCVYDVEPLKCIGTLGLIAITVYVINNYYTVSEFSYQMKVSLFFLFLFCTSFIVGAEKVLAHLENVSKLKAVNDFIEAIFGNK